MFMRNKLVRNVASCQISIWTRHMERKLTQASRTCGGRRKGVSEEPHHSLQRQMPSTPCSPSRLVLAKTRVFIEKNTAKKLTLGDWRQHSVLFTFLWSYFQVLKSIKKYPSCSTVTWNIFLFPGSRSEVEMDRKWHVCLTLVCAYVFHSVSHPFWNNATQQINNIKCIHPGLLSHLSLNSVAWGPFENMWPAVYYLGVPHILNWEC